MILCITPNPAIDRTLVVPDLQPGQAARPTRTIVAAGGKGFNVARAVQRLGGQAQCAGLLGGHTGRLVADLAEAERLAGVWTWCDRETRQCTIIVVEQQQHVLEIYEPGQPITSDDWTRFRADVVAAARETQFVSLSGSMPPGCPAKAPADLIESIQAAGRPVWVDTSGRPLRTALAACPHALKINAAEAGQILARTIDDVDSALKAGQDLRQQGVETVVITLGRLGAVLINTAGSWWSQPPLVQPVSAIASGDSFLAGLLVSLEAGLPLPEALRRSVAAGTANSLYAGGAEFALDVFETTLKETRLTEVG